ncbi:hypothetical protein PLESTB_000586900 [Pleodorina starrii]|uniref:Uncharacterized protein n=1 Tax=Pleodorina starrii TaxID=330485 RepID=A0A9W6BH61_9CHLO|nr:hypothetical protein PLESTM_000297900 [Pleodorina starrii]GLC52136.1 hypothetical protein PLESTB_000586900 [Pleodorina starrii]GLC72277.1 hypothetical protein PLESTF_001226900 [Pleodorina starrii]
MAEPLVQAASRLAESCALLAIGYNLKQGGILRTSDGETAIKVATTLTLPSLIVQALANGGPLGGGAASLLGVATVCMGAQLAATWLYCMSRPARERAVLSGSCTGLSLRLFGYPLVECFLGGPSAAAAGAAGAGAGAGVVAVAGVGVGGAALQAVALVDLVNHLAVWLGSYLLFAGAGPAFPESFKHEDGGDYRGQWRGLRKEGLGVYTYASGARYEGEWRNNVKEGRGVYYYPKGGVYEGEWSGGSMNGLGVRTFSTGQVKAGRWRDGQLEAPLELWQVALAADGATAVAAAARSVEVGGGRLLDAVHQLVAQPTLWALLAGVVLNVCRVPLPTSVDLVTRVLAQANAPLMLLAAGITAPKLVPPQGLRQLLPDIARLLGSRLLVPLTVGLNLVAMLAAGGGGGGFGAGVPAASLVPLAAALIALLAPVPPQALANARRFRLNESTAATITSVSYFICVPLMLLAGVAACAGGLASPPPPALPGAVAAATADARPLGVFALAAVAAVSAAVGYVAHRSSQLEEEAAAAAARPEDRRVLMVYAGPPGSAQGSPAPSATASVDEGSSQASASGAGPGRPTDGGPNTGRGTEMRKPSPPPPAAAAAPLTGAAATRGAASCWAGWSRCSVRRGAVSASRVACGGGAAAAAAGGGRSSACPAVALTGIARLGGGCYSAVVMALGRAATSGGACRGQGPGLCAARPASSDGGCLSAMTGSRRATAGLPRLLGPPAAPATQPRRLAGRGVQRAGAASVGSAGGGGGGVRF